MLRISKRRDPVSESRDESRGETMAGILKTLLFPVLWVMLLLLVASAVRQETLASELPSCGPGLQAAPVDGGPPLREAARHDP